MLLRTNYRKTQFIHRFLQTLTIDSASGYGTFSTGGFRPPRGGWVDTDVRIWPYSGDVLGAATMFWWARDISWSAPGSTGIFYASLFFSGTSFATLADTVSGCWMIEVLISSR